MKQSNHGMFVMPRYIKKMTAVKGSIMAALTKRRSEEHIKYASASIIKCRLINRVAEGQRRLPHSLPAENGETSTSAHCLGIGGGKPANKNKK